MVCPRLESAFKCPKGNYKYHPGLLSRLQVSRRKLAPKPSSIKCRVSLISKKRLHPNQYILLKRQNKSYQIKFLFLKWKERKPIIMQLLIFHIHNSLAYFPICYKNIFKKKFINFLFRLDFFSSKLDSRNVRSLELVDYLREA